MDQWTVPGWLAVLALAALVVLAVGCVAGLLAVRRARTQQARELADLREEVRRLATPAPAPSRRTPETALVITGLGEEPAPVAKHLATPAPVLPPAQFADQVLRESVVTAASLLHGVRRALSPRSLDHIRGEMRREVKRSRKQRRTDLRIARREYEARQRQQFDGGTAA